MEDQLEPEINNFLEVLYNLNQLTGKNYQDYYNEFTSGRYPPNFVSISDNINYIRSFDLTHLSRVVSVKIFNILASYSINEKFSIYGKTCVWWMGYIHCTYEFKV